MKLDMSKWKALSIKNRLKKGFRLTTFVASASGVIAGILMILVSMRYSSALTFYGFSQGDIGKDLEEISKEITDGMEIVPVERFSQVEKIAFVK